MELMEASQIAFFSLFALTLSILKDLHFSRREKKIAISSFLTNASSKSQIIMIASC